MTVLTQTAVEGKREWGTGPGQALATMPRHAGACLGGSPPLERPCVSLAGMEVSRKPISADPAWPFLLTLEFPVGNSLGRAS